MSGGGERSDGERRERGGRRSMPTALCMAAAARSTAPLAGGRRVAWRRVVWSAA